MPEITVVCPAAVRSQRRPYSDADLPQLRHAAAAVASLAAAAAEEGRGATAGLLDTGAPEFLLQVGSPDCVDCLEAVKGSSTRSMKTPPCYSCRCSCKRRGWMGLAATRSIRAARSYAAWHKSTGKAYDSECVISNLQLQMPWAGRSQRWLSAPRARRAARHCTMVLTTLTHSVSSRTCSCKRHGWTVPVATGGGRGVMPCATLPHSTRRRCDARRQRRRCPFRRTPALQRGRPGGLTCETTCSSEAGTYLRGSTTRATIVRYD